MKGLVQLARVLVGLLFIFSGLVKANDPLGLSYKMQEFFELWHMTRFNDWTLSLSVLMNAFEIIAGFALLIGWRIRLFSWLLLLLILFFTFLTGYTFVTGKPTNCGCFGDCLLISSKASFLKDVALTVLIALIFWKQKWIKPLLSRRAGFISMVLVTIFSFGLQWYALRYLPPVDCLPFKKGNNIPEKMKIPVGALPDSFAIRFIYEKGGKQFEFAPSDLPADLGSYTYVSRTDKLIRQGNAVPPIKGFTLTGANNEDSTQFILDQPTALLLISENFSVPFEDWKSSFGRVHEIARKKGVPIFFITGSRDIANTKFPEAGFGDVSVLTCDNTAIRTAARTNPCLYLLRKGTIVDKEGWRRWDKLTDQLLAMPDPPINVPVPGAIDTIIQPRNP